MPKTIFNVSADLVASAPETSSSEDPGKQTTDTTNTTDTEKKTNEPSATTSNTGLFTTVGKDGVVVDHTMPIIFGSIFFIGIIILCATIVKLRLRRVNSSYSLKKRQTSRVLGVFSGLMMLAGLGGLAGGFLSSSAINVPVEDISTSTVVKAELVDHTDTYKLYCGIDTITFNKATRNGWVLRAYGENDATLTSKDAKNTNIASIDDWKELPVGSWGFKTDREFYEELTDQNQYKPINLGNGVIAQSIFASEAGDTIDVTYCAKVDAKTVGDFTATINYEAELNGTSDSASDIPLMNGLFNYVDYDSPEDEDGDEMTSRQENRLGLNPRATDTDNDGLFDNEELEIYGTDPFNADTDGDGLLDYTEIALDEPLDPLKASTDGETLDSQRETTYTYEDEYSGIKVEITGTGNTPIFSADIYDKEADAANEAAFAAAEETGEDYEETPANILTSDINLYTEGNMTSATIEITYTDDQLAASGLSEDTMSVYYVNDEEETEDPYEKRESVLDTENNTITTTVNHFSHYFVASDDTPEEDYPVNPNDGIILPQPIEEDESVGAASGGAHTFSSTKNQKLKYNNDNKKDTIVADSTFRPQYHGFKFANIMTDFLEGYCYGMAQFAEQRFTKQLPTKTVAAVKDMTGFFSSNEPLLLPYKAQLAILEKKERQGKLSAKDKAQLETARSIRSYAFNLSGTEYTDYSKDLESIYIKTDVLKYTLDFKWSDLGQTAPTFTADDAHFNEDHTISALDRSYSDIITVDAYMLDDEGPGRREAVFTTKQYLDGRNPLLFKSKKSYSVDNYSGYGYKYVPSIKAMNEEPNTGIQNDDKQMLNALQYYAFGQMGDTHYYSEGIAKNIIDYLKNKDEGELLIRATDLIYRNRFYSSFGKTFVKTLTKYLNNKDPLVISFDVTTENGRIFGSHAVNATRLIQDGADSNKYYLEVYDNNYPRDTMVITFNCNLLNCRPLKYENKNPNGEAPGYQVKNLSISVLKGKSFKLSL